VVWHSLMRDGRRKQKTGNSDASGEDVTTGVQGQCKNGECINCAWTFSRYYKNALKMLYDDSLSII
jgi:hypothetical protein